MQIGLALCYYETAYATFPSGTMANLKLPPEKRLSWIVSILPYLEGGGPWLFDYDKAWDEGRNRLILRGEKETDRVHLTENIRFFRCPAGHHSVNSAGQGLTTYVGVAGLGADAPELPTGDRRAGLFGYQRATTRDQVKDGLSSTMCVIESTLGIGPWKAGGPMTLRGLVPTRQPYIGTNGQFGGTHRGGCTVLFADGSARFVRDTVDPTIFEALSTIAGGEKVPPRWDD
jgi:prepilin-type processing-associated H-X9-DG protein